MQTTRLYQFKIYYMKQFIFVIFSCLLSTSAFAVSRAEICTLRSRFIENFARSRDVGSSEKQTINETKKQLKMLFPKVAPPDMTPYIKMVYALPNVTPERFRRVAETSCLNGD